MKTIAVYGSLKKGLGNDWGTRDGKFHGETTVEGTMYSLGGYPVLMETKGEKPETEYQAEVYSISEDMYKQIHRMEIGAGYIAKDINTKYGLATIFYGNPERFTKERLSNLKQVNNWPDLTK